MLPVRIFFSKTGRAVYFSHLDLNRAVARLLMRSGLPVAFTEGFNPHARVVFAAPLAMYQRGLNEIFDFSLTEELPYDEIRDRMNAVTSPFLAIHKAAPPVMKLSECRWASYELALETDAPATEVQAIFEGSVVVTKKTKRSCAQTDISNEINSVTVQDTEDGVILHCVLAAAPDDYLNPNYIRDFAASRFPVQSCVITRAGFFNSRLEPFC